MSLERYDGPIEGIADFILGSMQEKAMAARTPIRSLAGEPYCPSSGTEGIEFENEWCCECDHYRHTADSTKANPDIDCDLGIYMAAFTHAPDVDDPGFPKQWVYDADGRPSCSAWKERTSSANAIPPGPPRLCGGTIYPGKEREAYERAMRGEG